LSRRPLLIVHFEWPAGVEPLVQLGVRLENPFRCEVRVLPEPIQVADCFDSRRAQYDSRRILERLLPLAGDGLVLGVTDMDLYLPVFTFVIGQALLGGRAAVISAYRLRQELYGFAADAERLATRMEKEALHELGHCHGLVHCLDSRCIMYAAATVSDVDLRQARFCPRCQRALSAVIDSEREGEERPTEQES